MSLRNLPTTIVEILGTLRESMGWPGLVVGILCLPFVLTAVLALMPFVWAWRLLARRDLRPSQFDSSFEDGTLVFSWSGNGRTARQALSDAIRLLIEALELLPEIEKVTTLEVRNPSTGFAIDEEHLGVIREDLVANLTDALWTGKLEYGELVVNEAIVLGGLDVEARSSLSGHLSLDLPTLDPSRLPRAGNESDPETF